MESMNPNEAIRKVSEQYRFVCRDRGVYMDALEKYGMSIYKFLSDTLKKYHTCNVI